VADKKYVFRFAGRDEGVARTLDKIGESAGDAADETSKLSAGQLELREAALKAQQAEDRLATAREKLSKVTKLAAASDQDKRRAAQAVEAAEIRHEKALRGVADAADLARRSVTEAGDAADKAGEKAEGGARGFLSFSKKLGGGLKGGLVAGLSGLPVAAMAIGALAGTALIAGIKKTLNVQDSTAKFKVQLGLTEKESKRSGEVAGRLYAGAYGDSMDQVNTAMRSVIANGAVLRGAMSADLEDVTGKVLNLANTFDQDLGATTRAVGQMIRTGLAKDGKDALDILTRGFQTGLDKAEDLLDTTNEYGTQWRKVGLDGRTAFGMVSQALRAGARDADIAGDAIKEFSILAIDTKSTAGPAFKALGFDAEDMAAKIARGGKSAAGGLDETLDRLRKVKDPVKQAELAVALFGTQAEDLGAALFAMDPSTAVAALGKVGGAADKMGKDLTTPAAKLTGIKRALELKVQSWLVDAFEWVNENRFEIAEGLLDIADAVVGMIRPLAAVASGGLRVGQAMLYVAAAQAAASGKIGQSIELKKMGDNLGKVAREAWDLGDTLQRKASPAVDALRAKVAAVKSKRITVEAVDRASKVAQRVRAELARTPNSKRVTVQVTSAGTVQMVQREINRLTGKVVAIQVGTIATGRRAMADGGQVLGPGGPRDDKIPALLSNREYVMPAEQADRYLPILEAMRHDRVAMMAGGGRVGGAGTLLGAMSGGGGSTVLQPIVVQLDGRTIWQSLVRLKSREGVPRLGLA